MIRCVKRLGRITFCHGKSGFYRGALLSRGFTTDEIHWNFGMFGKAQMSFANCQCQFSTKTRFGLLSSVKPISEASWQTFIEPSCPEAETDLSGDLIILKDFISEDEERSILDEVEPYLKRLIYEYDHWDDAIHGYRETEKKQWTEKNKLVIQRVRDLAFPPGTPQLAYVHVLDIAKEGYIKAHIDSVRFCGSTITGLSLLSSSVMRLVHETEKSKMADVLLLPRSLYIMKGKARFDYTHEILSKEASKFRGEIVERDRRISVICRNEPADTEDNSR